MKITYLQEYPPEDEKKVIRITGNNTWGTWGNTNYTMVVGNRWYNLTEEQQHYEAMRLHAQYQRQMEAINNELREWRAHPLEIEVADNA